MSARPAAWLEIGVLVTANLAATLVRFVLLRRWVFTSLSRGGLALTTASDTDRRRSFRTEARPAAYGDQGRQAVVGAEVVLEPLVVLAALTIGVGHRRREPSRALARSGSSCRGPPRPARPAGASPARSTAAARRAASVPPSAVTWSANSTCGRYAVAAPVLASTSRKTPSRCSRSRTTSGSGGDDVESLMAQLEGLDDRRRSSRRRARGPVHLHGQALRRMKRMTSARCPSSSVIATLRRSGGSELSQSHSVVSWVSPRLRTTLEYLRSPAACAPAARGRCRRGTPRRRCWRRVPLTSRNAALGPSRAGAEVDQEVETAVRISATRHRHSRVPADRVPPSVRLTTAEGVGFEPTRQAWGPA